MDVRWLILLVVVNFDFVLPKISYDERPRIYVRDGHLMFVASTYKNISFETAKNSGVSINNIDLLTTLNKAHDATKLTENYHKALTTYNDRIDALEERLTLGPPASNQTQSNDTSFLSLRMIRKQNRRILMLERWANALKRLLSQDKCASIPCKNGGTCLDLLARYRCQCAEGWEGLDCTVNINECSRFVGTDLGCQNGATCKDTQGSYECLCPSGWTGLHCTRRGVDCLAGGIELCGHGTCIQTVGTPGYKCICDQGYTTDGTNPACTLDVNECNQNHPACSASPKVECINVPGSYYCGPCPQGYTGNGYHCVDIDECSTNNGGCSTNPMVMCINSQGSRICGPCPAGYSGDGTSCSYQGVCNINNGGCHNLATCRENSRIGSSYVECKCPAGYVGNGIGPAGCSSVLPTECHSNNCKHGHCTTSASGSHMCKCVDGYSGIHCDIPPRDQCTPNPCLNDGECQNVKGFNFKCNCKPGFTGSVCGLEEADCGGPLKASNGVLKFPSNNQTYEQSSSCAWTISTDDSTKVLKITIKKFNLKDSSNCETDFLEIHDGRNTASPSLGRFCGTNLPLNGSFTTTHDKLYLWLAFDETVSTGGFEIMWNATDWKCGGSLSDSHGTIQSPGAPGNYPPRRDCWWRLSAPPGKRFLFTFFLLNIGNNKGCTQDIIQFFTMLDYMRDNDKFKKICNSTKPEPFYSPGPTVMIHFHSNLKDTYPGFQMSYQVVEGEPGCGGVYSLASGVIQSPSETTSSICEYRIQQPQNSKIIINFEQFDVEEGDCESTYLEIFEGSNTKAASVGRYCGPTSILPPSYTSYTNELTVVFASDEESSSIDWRIRYIRACGEKFTNESGTFKPTTYYSQNTIQCIYQIERPPGNIIELVLKLSFGAYHIHRRGSLNSAACYSSYVEVRDGDLDTSPLIGRYCETKEINITSSHNALWIKLHLIPYLFAITDIGDVFTAEYTSVNAGCGGILRKPFGHISSPTHVDGGYPPQHNCKWVIIAPPRSVIKLSWMTFSIEQSHDCNYDNVKIFDNNTDLGNGEELGRFCGNNLPPVLFSSSNVMTVAFSSDLTIHNGEFLASFNFIKEGEVCNINYGSSTGVLKSPGYPSPYPSNKECTYVVTVQPGQQILLNVTAFEIEPYPGCRYDYLEIRNGGSFSSPLVGKYCGKTIPKLIWSHTNKVYLYFKSDNSRSATGFRMVWTSGTTGCGGTLTSEIGSIVSPNYPEPYYRNAECVWNIIVNAGSRIQVIFSDINLEKSLQCLADYVQLFDDLAANSKSLGKYCNDNKTAVLSTENRMRVKFRSDINYQGRGFQLHYSTVCHNILSGYHGVIESPNFPNEYSVDEDCLWEIIVPDRNKINITFSHFALETSPNFVNASCMYDYVEIKYAEEIENAVEEEHTYLTYGRFCGRENPGHISINSDHVQIHFVSDGLLIGPGFRLEWVLWGCGGHLTQDSGTITSPNYPNPYPLSVKCDWKIEVEFGKSIEIEFHNIDVEKDDLCEYDHVKVYNGPSNDSNLLATICRQKKSSVISSTGNFMFIEFKSDYSFQGTGFTANYTTVPTNCGGRLTAAEGYIYSPNYPQNYNRNESCGWLIDVDESHSIELTFDDVDLYVSNNCTKNYIKIHDGPTEAYPVLKTVCGKKTPNETIKSTYNYMYVKFQTHTHITTKGFKATYRKSCGSRIATQGSGTLELDYSEFSNNIQSCQWTIVSVDPTKHVSMTITQIHGLTFCDMYENEKPIKVYNGESTESPLIGSYCGAKIPPMLVSDGSALTVDITQIQISFFASYSVYDSHCGGTLGSKEGYFATPGYPKQYPSDVQCEWIINIAKGNSVALNFINFELIESQNCNTDYLEIRATNSSGPLLGVFCGENKPSNITNVGSLWLMFKSKKLEPGDTPSAKGFYAEYAMSTTNELSGPGGTIESPLYPKLYMEFGTFSWKITVRTRRKILLSFKELYVEPDMFDDCSLSSLEAFDGVDDTATSLGKFCGIALPDPIRSSSNIMFIKAAVNGNRMGTKFRFQWLETASVFTPGSIIRNNTCGSDEVIDIVTLTNNSLTSPGFPYGYANNLQCTWIFSTIPMNHLKVYFTSINLDSEIRRIPGNRCDIFDHIRISQKRTDNNEWEVVKDICRSDGARTVSVTNLMKLQFVTNGYMNGTGFKAYIFDRCGGVLKDSSGYITFNHSSLIGNDCQWNITVHSTRSIELIFQQMNIAQEQNNLCGSYLLIRNGKFPDSPILGSGKYCGNTLPSNIKSTGNSLYIKYKRKQHTSDSFRIKYREISASCGGTTILTTFDNFTEISSPNYPNIPQTHIECQWLMHAPYGGSLRIDFEERFDLTVDKNCEKEYVELRDGGTEFSPLIGRYCSSTPSSQITSGNMLFVKFFTDTDEPKNGFKAKISLGYCGGTIRGSSGYVSLSNLISAVQEYNCTWHISGPRDHYLILFFTSMQIVCNDPMDNNFVSIIEDGHPYERYCGKGPPPRNITTAGNEVIVNYVGNNTGTFKLGFKASFRASQTECGGTLETESGEITSPGYPQRNYMNRRCIWKIMVPEGRRITVEFSDLDLNGEMYTQALWLYDGLNFSVLLAMFMGAHPKQIVRSSSNSMLIRYWTTGRSSHRGFKLQYTSNEPTICKGDFNKMSGEIRNPDSKNNSYACKWTHRSANQVFNETFAMSISLQSDVTNQVCAHTVAELLITTEDNNNVLGKLCRTNLKPEVIRSPYLVTNVLARTGIRTHLNFTLSYQTHPCGGIVKKQDGFIQSPTLSYIPESIECVWLLKADSDQKINLTVASMDLGDDCESNFFSVRNGGSPQHPQIGKFCQKNKPGAIVSQSESLWVEYKWKKGSTGTGIKLKYEALSFGCGGIFHDKSRIIETPDYGKDYPNNAECLWEIQAKEGYTVQLKFVDRFHIEENTNCTNDYVELFDWKSDEWVSLGRKCGRNTPAEIISTSNKMRVLFRTNEKLTAAGFKARWDWQCGGTFEATSAPRYIVSPGYPVQYENNLNCVYVIKPRTNGILNIQFIDFDLEQAIPDCRYDNVTIIGGYSYISYATQKVYCEKSKPLPMRTKSKVTITFKTDLFLVRKGFKFVYSDDSCGGSITEETTIEAKRFKNYSSFLSPRYSVPFLQCAWNITAPPKQIVVLTVLNLNMIQSPMCYSQSVSVYKDLNQKLPNRLAKLCSQLEHVTLVSHTGKMLVKLEAMPLNFGGFKAFVSFSHSPAEGCGGMINLTDSMTIQSPDLEDIDCTWQIRAPMDYKVHIQFTELDLPENCKGNGTACDCSFIEIKDGSSPFSETIEKLCPNSSLAHDYRTFSSSWNTAYLRFFIRGKNGNAFKAKLTPKISICGPSLLNITKEIKTLKSPNFPNPYPANTRCTYLFATPRNTIEQMRLHFVEFDLTEEVSKPNGHHLTECKGDTVQIYEDPNEISLSNGLGPATIYSGTMSRNMYLFYDNGLDRYTFCGKEDKPFDYYSSKKLVTVTLNSLDTVNKGKGFLLEYSLAGCNRNYSELTARILNSNLRTNCSLSITVPENYTIALYFYQFWISPTTNCADAFEVRDGSADGKVLLKYCGFGLPNPVFSYSNKLYIHVKNKARFASTRYEFSYTSTKNGRGCGGELYSIRGRIYSPMYPDQFRNDTECNWVVKPPIGLHMVLRFISFDLQGSCDQTYIEMTTYSISEPSKDTTTRFCKDEIPGIIRSESVIKIRYKSTMHNGGAGWVALYRAVNKDITNVAGIGLY